MSTPQKSEEEYARYTRRSALKALNVSNATNGSSKPLDSSLKRYSAFIKKIRQSIGTENRDQLLKDIETLSLEKYVDELDSAVLEGILRCKSEKDVWSAVEIISAIHRRFPTTFTPKVVDSLAAALAPPSRASLAGLPPEQREKDDTARIAKQRPVLRVCSELVLVGIIRESPDRSGGEWIMKVLKELLSNDPSLSSLPLLTTFLKSYSRPYLGITSPQLSRAATNGDGYEHESNDPEIIIPEAKELVEKDIRDRFRKMCEGYFQSVSKKLVNEHNRLQEQDRRNHEAYIRSGEIFEDRQQAYEKMTKNYEKLLSNCQSLSELLYLPVPNLPSASQKSESIMIGSNTGRSIGEDGELLLTAAGKWEDEEERKFFEDIQDLRDYVPKSILGLEDGEEKTGPDEEEKKPEDDLQVDMKKLDEELAGLESKVANGITEEASTDGDISDEDNIPTPTPGSPKTDTAASPQLAPQGPSQILTVLLARLPDATNRTLIDQAAVEFAFLNSKAARKRLIKFFTQIPKNRNDVLPYYSRFIATLSKYMPDVSVEVVKYLSDEFKYLQRKKNVKELTESRMKNIAFLSNLTKFGVVPSHLILYMFKSCLDNFTGSNVENVAWLLEGCGRYLLRSDVTHEPFAKMLELMKRKQAMQHFDQRQTLLLENAYYQCNPPERAPREEKQRTVVELFIRHLVYDVLSKRTIDKVLKLIRKLDWNDAPVRLSLHKAFTKPWKLNYGNVGLMAMLANDLNRYHPNFVVSVVDQILEDIRRGLEQNVYNTNQRRVATIKYLGELYNYRLLNSGIIFDTLWSLVTFGHPDGRPLPGQFSPIDTPDDFFRIRLVCVLLDTCGMCFDRGSQKRKLDNYLNFFQMYVLSKDPLPMDVEFMLYDSLEAVRPKLVMFKTFEEAVLTVDEMFTVAFQTAGLVAGEDSGEDSGGEGPKRGREDEEETEETLSPVDERTPSPEAVLLRGSQESMGPSAEADAEFEKELAKMMTDTSTESRRVDRKTALALWDSAALPTGLKKKRADDFDEDGDTAASTDEPVMNFTFVTKRGKQQQTRKIPVPAESALAVQTRTAQMQDRVEQQQLKRLVLNYEQREEAEELKALEAQSRPIKIRLAG